MNEDFEFIWEFYCEFCWDIYQDVQAMVAGCPYCGNKEEQIEYCWWFYSQYLAINAPHY